MQGGLHLLIQLRQLLKTGDLCGEAPWRLNSSRSHDGALLEAEVKGAAPAPWTCMQSAGSSRCAKVHHTDTL